jgi:HEAT repeat protein
MPYSWQEKCMNRKYRKSGNSKLILFMLGFLSAAAAAGAQNGEPIRASYERNFVRANLATKAGILRDAATDERAAEFIGPLYEFALNFALQNAEMLRDDPDMIALTVLASRGAGVSGHHPSVDTLWKVFSAYRDSLTRVEVLGALALLGKGNGELVENLNQFLANQNNLYRSGMTPDYPTLSACISTLSVLGDGSSFPVLFSAMIAGYPDSITQEASRALSSIEGDYKQYLIEVIRKNPPAEKLTAFREGNYNKKFTDSERGEVAQTALEVSLDLFPGSPEGETAVSNLRYASVQVLTELKWTRATSLAIKHYYRVQKDYANGLASKVQYSEAITCLGAMGSSEAAQVLALQLGFINSQMERINEFDEVLTLAIVKALGEIGDKIAFDYLLYIAYLTYPESIQIAAREALNRLKW